jgi:hypothetical protein
MFQSIRNTGCFRYISPAKRHQLRLELFNVGSFQSVTSAMTTLSAPNTTSTLCETAARPLSAAEIISKNYLQKDASITRFINAGTDLLNWSHQGIYDDRVLRCIESLNADVIDDYIKQQIFLCATENFSRVHGAKRTDFFRELISQHIGRFDVSESFSQSDAVIWSDSYIRELGSKSLVCTSGEKVGSYLEAHLNQLANTIAATPTWFDNVETVRRNLLRTLNHRVVRIPLKLKRKRFYA